MCTQVSGLPQSSSNCVTLKNIKNTLFPLWNTISFIISVHERHHMMLKYNFTAGAIQVIRPGSFVKFPSPILMHWSLTKRREKKIVWHVCDTSNHNLCQRHPWWALSAVQLTFWVVLSICQQDRPFAFFPKTFVPTLIIDLIFKMLNNLAPFPALLTLSNVFVTCEAIMPCATSSLAYMPQQYWCSKQRTIFRRMGIFCLAIHQSGK